MPIMEVAWLTSLRPQGQRTAGTDAGELIAGSGNFQYHCEVNTSPNSVTISVTAFERADLLEICLRSLVAQTYGDIEIRVFDNSASDDVRRLIEDISDRRIIYERNSPNVAEALINHQKAFVPGRSKYHMVLSSDWALRNDAIELLVRRLERDSTVCLATGNWAQRHLPDDRVIDREPLFQDLEMVGRKETTIDSHRFIEAAFGRLRGVGIVYHSLIASDALRYSNLEKVYVNQGYEHQAGLELALLKPGFAIVREPLFIELVNQRRYNPGQYRKFARLSEAIARARFLEKKYPELLAGGFPVSRLRAGLCLMFIRCAFRQNENPFEALFFAARYALPMMAAWMGLIIAVPFRMSKALLRGAFGRKDVLNRR